MADISNSPSIGESGDMSKRVSNIKHDWYQTESHVFVTILAKNTKEENVKVEFGNENVSIIF
jgi:suppressor of G2 allele of SKP1